MKKITIILYSLFCSLPLLAQETLSLKECREMALKYNKEIAASVKQTESARYTAKSYKGNFFPNFTASGTGLYSNADGSYGIAGGNLPTFLPDATGQPVPNGGFAYFPGINLDYKIGWVYMGGVQVEQPLYMGGKILSAYRMSVLGKEMAQMNETLTATEVILKTDQAYALVVKAKEMKTVADKYNAVLAELKKNVESAHKHGLKPQNDVLKVQVKLNESELSIRKAENALRLATMNLCHLIGKPLTSDIRVSGDFPEIEQDLEIQVLDITARPEYGILDKQVAIAKQQVKLNRSELLPKIGVRGSYDYVHGLEINKENLLDKGSFSVLLNVSVPLFHFGERSNKVRAAKAKLEQTRLQQQNMNEQMLLELTQAANNLDEAKLESELSNRSLQQAEENMRVSKSQYEVGLETLSDHLEAQALWQQAYEIKVDAHFQLYLNYVEYLKATGTLYERE
ncbi:TolC family protein [Phocaeicola sp.]